MAQGENAEKRSKAGKEWWGKRPLSNTSASRKSKTMKYWKRLLHKIERRMGKDDILSEVRSISEIEPQIKTTMTDLVKEIASLPMSVTWKGVEAKLILFPNGTDDFRLCYSYTDVNILEYADFDYDFLYLYENISDESDLRNAIADCREFLITHNIWKP